MPVTARRIDRLPVVKDSFQSDRCAPLLKALAEPARLRIIDVLRSGEKNVGEVAAALDMEVVNASHHLGILKRAGLAESRRDGRHIIYHLAEGIFESDGAGRPSEQINLGCCQLVVPKAPRQQSQR